MNYAIHSSEGNMILGVYNPEGKDVLIRGNSVKAVTLEFAIYQCCAVTGTSLKDIVIYPLS